MIPHRRLLCPLLLALFLAGCESNPASKTANNPAAEGAAISTAPLDPAGFQPIWRGELGLNPGDNVTGIFPIGDSVYVYVGNDSVRCFDRSTGVMRWSILLGNSDQQVPRPPIVFKDYVVFPTKDTLEIYHRYGDFLKSISIGYKISSPVVGINDLCCMGIDFSGGRIELVNIDRAYHNVDWDLMMDGAVLGAPAIYQGTIFAGSEDGGIRAVGTDRSSAWFIDNDNPAQNDEYLTGGPIRTDIAADRSGVYVANEDGRLVCLEPDTGHLNWEYLSPVSFQSGPILGVNLVYQPVPGEGIIAFEKHDTYHTGASHALILETERQPIWHNTEVQQVLSEDDNYLYCLSNGGHVIAIDMTSGATVFRTRVNHLVAYARDPDDSTIFGVSDTGSLWAIKPIVRPGVEGFISAPQ